LLFEKLEKLYFDTLKKKIKIYYIPLLLLNKKLKKINKNIQQKNALTQ
jgi:hypothetical protein